jgi:hypothetical protein
VSPILVSPILITLAVQGGGYPWAATKPIENLLNNCRSTMMIPATTLRTWCSLAWLSTYRARSPTPSKQSLALVPPL